MLKGLPTDGPRKDKGANPSRHHWALNKAVRLFAARRRGCLSDDDLSAGLELVRVRLLALLATGEKRAVAPREWAGIVVWARQRVESFTMERLASEVPHDHGDTTAGTAAVDKVLQAVGRVGVAADDDDGAPELFADVAAFLVGGGPVAPLRVAGRRTDGESLFYAEQVNVLFGDPESGKTWLALWALAEALRDGEATAMIDMDHNGLGAIVGRLRLLGVPDTILSDQSVFRYAAPEDHEHLADIIAALVQWRPAVVVVDSIGELLPLLKLSSNSPDDYTVANKAVLKPLARAGACVIAIDHLAKNSDSRVLGPSGTLAKKRTVGGVSLRVTAFEKFTPGVGGKAALTVHKDRHGGVRGVCPQATKGEASAGVFVMSTAEVGTKCYVATPGAPGATGQDPDHEHAAFNLSDRVAEVIALLDQLQVPESHGRDRARKALLAQGITVTNGDLALAVKVRKNRG